ncbi:MAG: non-homologous end-joining DNA ligase [Phycisphaeraceae bacterium]|nr:non-homologous end-joining DNA ligase [Phycisphaeraceae bacterium]
MDPLLKQLPSSCREALKKKKQPTWTHPMLATLTDEVFSDEDWIFERKLDGVRCLVFRTARSVRLMSRNRNNMNSSYPELVDALKEQKRTAFVADGEIVAFKGRRTSFSRLQPRMHVQDEDEARQSGVKVFLYLFDLLHLAGYDTTALPLLERKKLLKRALEYRDPIQFSAHRNQQGKSFFNDACDRGWEGLIAKRARSVYRHARSRDWLKFKCTNRQELVVGGWTDPKGNRTGLGALLVGHYHRDRLLYAGKVGTGYDEQTLGDLRQRLDRLKRQTCPFELAPDQAPDVHWVTPKLVIEVEFTEWTHEGKLRHPRYVGLRHDKDAREVVRESPR